MYPTCHVPLHRSYAAVWAPPVCRSNTKYWTAENIVPHLDPQQLPPSDPTNMCKCYNVWSSYGMLPEVNSYVFSGCAQSRSQARACAHHVCYFQSTPDGSGAAQDQLYLRMCRHRIEASSCHRGLSSTLRKGESCGRSSLSSEEQHCSSISPRYVRTGSRPPSHAP